MRTTIRNNMIALALGSLILALAATACSDATGPSHDDCAARATTPGAVVTFETVDGIRVYRC